MSTEVIIGANIDRAELVIPSFGSTPPLRLDLTKIREGESRLHEAQVVNVGSYSNLEFVFNEGYREGKRHLSIIGYQISLAEKALREAKSRALLDDYKDFLTKKNIKDSAQIRDAFLETQIDFVMAQDRIDMLKAMESLIDGKIKVFENTCRYLKKQMEIELRGGMDFNKYVR